MELTSKLITSTPGEVKPPQIELLPHKRRKGYSLWKGKSRAVKKEVKNEYFVSNQ